MLHVFIKEYEKRDRTIKETLLNGKVSEYDYYSYAIQQIDLLLQACPNDPSLIAKQAEFYHLSGNLRLASEKYKAVIELSKPLEVTEKELYFMKKFCPFLYTQNTEPFLLKDIVAIHHPEMPIIGYHLFWEDDYDFPDDQEPSDHEEVWIHYDPIAEKVMHVYTWFHSRIIESASAVEEANENGGRAKIRIEWGKHGSLLHGWETLTDPYTNITLYDWMKKTYERMKQGGREKNHPLKRYWPNRFEGSFSEYITFSKVIDPLNWLQKKPLYFKSLWVNALLFTHCIHYNFHPKMEWPERFYASLTDE